jgi:hypothetical protein
MLQLPLCLRHHCNIPRHLPTAQQASSLSLLLLHCGCATALPPPTPHPPTSKLLVAAAAAASPLHHDYHCVTATTIAPPTSPPHSATSSQLVAAAPALSRLHRVTTLPPLPPQPNELHRCHQATVLLWRVAATVRHSAPFAAAATAQPRFCRAPPATALPLLPPPPRNHAAAASRCRAYSAAVAIMQLCCHRAPPAGALCRSLSSAGAATVRPRRLRLPSASAAMVLPRCRSAFKRHCIRTTACLHTLSIAAATAHCLPPLCALRHHCNRATALLLQAATVTTALPCCHLAQSLGALCCHCHRGCTRLAAAVVY